MYLSIISVRVGYVLLLEPFSVKATTGEVLSPRAISPVENFLTGAYIADVVLLLFLSVFRSFLLGQISRLLLAKLAFQTHCCLFLRLVLASFPCVHSSISLCFFLLQLDRYTEMSMGLPLSMFVHHPDHLAPLRTLYAHQRYLINILPPRPTPMSIVKSG